MSNLLPNTAASQTQFIICRTDVSVPVRTGISTTSNFQLDSAFADSFGFCFLHLHFLSDFLKASAVATNVFTHNKPKESKSNSITSTSWKWLEYNSITGGVHLITTTTFPSLAQFFSQRLNSAFHTSALKKVSRSTRPGEPSWEGHDAQTVLLHALHMAALCESLQHVLWSAASGLQLPLALHPPHSHPSPRPPLLPSVKKLPCWRTRTLYWRRNRTQVRLREVTGLERDLFRSRMRLETWV